MQVLKHIITLKKLRLFDYRIPHSSGGQKAIFKSCTKEDFFYYANVFDYGESEYSVLPVALVLDSVYDHEIDHIVEKELANINPYKTIIFQWGDYEPILDSIKNFIVLQHASSRRSASYTMPYCVSDYIYKYSQLKGPVLNVSFMGARTHPIRKLIPNFLKDIPRSFCELFPKKYLPNYSNKKTYNDIMNRSKFILCPPGAAPGSFRFYECLKLGKIPILFNNLSNFISPLNELYELPFEWLINYDDFVLYYDHEKQDLGKLIKDYEDRHDLNVMSDKIISIYQKYLEWNSIKLINLIVNRLKEREKTGLIKLF